VGAAALTGLLHRSPFAGLTDGRKLERVGLQLYTVRRNLAADFEGTLARVAATGYKEVEFAGYFDREPDAVRATLDRLKLAAPGAHVPLQSLDAWEKTLEVARRIGHRYVVIPSIPREDRQSLEGYRRAAQRLNQAGKAARLAELRLAYHNHDFEFTPIEGKRPYDLLLAETDPTFVEFEMDLYHIIQGGGDPVDYFTRHPGRFPLVHVKDSDASPERHMVDVGQGVIDFRKILARHESAGIRHYFVERDDAADPLASIKVSYEYLSRLEF
jgi:sugar phosphate isomerase/epimerase